MRVRTAADGRLLELTADLKEYTAVDAGLGSVHPTEGAGLHQFHDGRWIKVANHDAFVVVPHLLGGGLGPAPKTRRARSTPHATGAPSSTAQPRPR